MRITPQAFEEKDEVDYMIKAEFERKFAERGYTIRQSKKIVNDFLMTIADVLMDGEEIIFRGFGKFELRDRKIYNKTKPGWLGSAVGVGDTYKSVKFVPTKSFRVSIATGAPPVIDKKVGGRGNNPYKNKSLMKKRVDKDSGDE